jgi:hypothetical protein
MRDSQARFAQLKQHMESALNDGPGCARRAGPDAQGCP